MTEEQYSSEFECDPFAAILGAYYGKDIAACEAEGRITRRSRACRFILHGTSVTDISTAIWFFQVIGPEVRIIDFYENHGQYADHYCGVVPHDARVHERGTGKTRLDTLIALGRKPVLVPDRGRHQRRAFDVQARLVRRSEVRAGP
jgi:phage terminase large subunit